MSSDTSTAPAGEIEAAIPLGFFREHPGLLLTIGYLLLILMGLIYEVWLFKRFRVNILYYAEATDFLLVPFREPLVMFVSLAPIPLLILYMRSATWISTRVGAEKLLKSNSSPRVRFISQALAIFLWSVAFSANYAEYVEKAVRAGKRKDVTVELSSGAKIAGPLLGTTNQFVFVFDRATNTTHAAQSENVVRIIVDSRRRKSGK